MTPDTRIDEPPPRLPRAPVHMSRRSLALLVLIFLVIFASRVMRLNTLNMEKDEVWSVWQTLGSLQDTMAWTPYDWSPVSYLIVHVWRALTGISPFTLRVFTILIMLLSAALVYRNARKLFADLGEYCDRAALLATLAFSAFGYMLFISTILRTYQVNLLLWLAALWMTMRYFERPTRWSGILLGLTLAAMFYVHLSAVFGIVALGLFGVVMYRRVWHWRLPAIVTAVLCLPEALNKLSVIPQKNQIAQQFILPYYPPLPRLGNLYLDFAGQQFALWAALFLVATALLLDRWRVQRRAVMLVVWMLLPVVIIWPAQYVDAFNPRHLPWVMVAFALWIGWGLSLLPRPALAALSAVLAVVMFDYIPLNERYETVPRVPLVTSFNTLRQVFRNGDVLMIDPKCEGCAPVDREEWDYFARAYFPESVAFIGPDQSMPVTLNRRIWYVAARGKEDPAAFSPLVQNRALSRTFGEKNLLFRLYEAPPDPIGVPFANGMSFHGAEILNSGGLNMAWHEGDTVYVRLFWSAERPVDLDYSVGTYLLNNKDGSVQAQTDLPPQVLDGPKETSRWPVGRLFVEERTLSLPNPLETGERQIGLAVYHFTDGLRIAAPGLNPDKLLLIGKIFIKSL